MSRINWPLVRAVIVIGGLLIFLFATRPASAHQFNCDEVRAYVAQYGKAKALAAAIKHGATWREIKEARKCLK